MAEVWSGDGTFAAFTRSIEVHVLLEALMMYIENTETKGVDCAVAWELWEALGGED